MNIFHMVKVLRLNYKDVYSIVFQRHSTETHQGCRTETCPVFLPWQSCESHDPAETGGGALSCTHSHTDFSFHNCSMCPVPYLC